MYKTSIFLLLLLLRVPWAGAFVKCQVLQRDDDDDDGAGDDALALVSFSLTLAKRLSNESS